MTRIIPPTRPIALTVPQPTFCNRCEVHQAMSTHPVCPVCLDEDRRAKERE